MSVQAFGAIDIFPELNLSRVCRNVDASAIADKAVCKMVLGRNYRGVGDQASASVPYTAATYDGVTDGQNWPNYVIGINYTAYPTTSMSGYKYPIVGVNASGGSIASGGYGKIVFQGVVKMTLTLVNATDDHIPGAFVYLNSGTNYRAEVSSTTADIDTGDIIIGRTLEHINNTSAATVDCVCYLNGIFGEWQGINAA